MESSWVTYSEIDNMLIKNTIIEDNLNRIQITIKINLRDETIEQSGEPPRLLNTGDLYTFRSIFSEVEISDSLMTSVLGMKFMDEYLSMRIGAFDIPYNWCVNFWFLFSSLVVPYQMVDWEMEIKPQYRSLIFSSFAKSNNVSLYGFKTVCRWVLLIPGVVLSPLIMLGTLCALSRMG